MIYSTQTLRNGDSVTQRRLCQPSGDHQQTDNRHRCPHVFAHREDHHPWPGLDGTAHNRQGHRDRWWRGCRLPMAGQHNRRQLDQCILTSSLECVDVRTVTSVPLDLSTAISTSDSVASFHYYPNPVQSTLTIDSLQPAAGWYAAEVAGIDGARPLLTNPITGLSRVTIDMTTLPKGIYFVVLLRTTGANKYFKVLKL